MKRNWFVLLGSVLGALVLMLACSGTKKADLVIVNGRVVTVDDRLPEAEAVAVRDDRVLAVGTNEEIQKLVQPSTRVIDVQGKLVIPGFIEGHGHFVGLGQSLMRLNLTHVRNFDEIVAMVKEAVAGAKPGEWILGRGWHQEKWDRVPQPNVDGLPYHNALSAVSPDNPVLLTHASGHSCMANAKAMALAGITRDTPDPEGGEIVRDPDGNPIGVFRETAQGLLSRARMQAQKKRTPEQREIELRRAIKLAAQECLSKGITTFHDAGTSFRTIDLYKKMIDEGELRLRLWVMIRESNDRLKEKIANYKIIGYGNNHLTVRAIKRLIDGALGSHGAWLLQPYNDLPTSTGLNTTPLETIHETAQIAIENGFQLCTHAIGDRANRETLNIYEETFQAHPDQIDLRWRIEHAQHIDPQDIPRFGKLGVIASMQGIHCTSDGPWVIKRLGEKRAREGAYVWQKLMKGNAVVTNGTDCPVEDPDPIFCFYASVTRKLKDGSLFFPDQRMSRMEALKSYTLNNAFAGFEEDLKGSLTPGKLADIVVLSKDILTVPEEEIMQSKVVYTIVGGKVLVEKKEEAE